MTRSVEQEYPSIIDRSLICCLNNNQEISPKGLLNVLTSAFLSPKNQGPYRNFSKTMNDQVVPQPVFSIQLFSNYFSPKTKMLLYNGLKDSLQQKCFLNFHFSFLNFE
jgi:hypothetical protein